MFPQISKTIQQIFDNLFLEDFQQEYECAYVDEASAWISWGVIKSNQQEDLVCFKADKTENIDVFIQSIRKAMLDGKMESVLYGGIDVGRTRDLTEFYFLFLRTLISSKSDT